MVKDLRMIYKVLARVEVQLRVECPMIFRFSLVKLAMDPEFIPYRVAQLGKKETFWCCLGNNGSYGLTNG